jgi:hypothetical protein
MRRIRSRRVERDREDREGARLPGRLHAGVCEGEQVRRRGGTRTVAASRNGRTRTINARVAGRLSSDGLIRDPDHRGQHDPECDDLRHIDMRLS